jgi:penicillin-binding protein 1C
MFVTSIPQQLCASEDIDLFTTIDRDLSQHSRDTLEGTIHTLEKENIHNGALYILNPRNNTILTYIGNRSVSSRENAIDMIPVRRSVGSILKPFLYSIILADGHDGESLILDDTQIYKTESGKDYVPENYIPKSYGPIRIKEALGNSLNSSAVRFAEHI